MSDITEKWEEDAEWLRRKLIAELSLIATEDEVDAFCERVAIKMANGMGEAWARDEALAELVESHAQD